MHLCVCFWKKPVNQVLNGLGQRNVIKQAWASFWMQLQRISPSAIRDMDFSWEVVLIPRSITLTNSYFSYSNPSLNSLTLKLPTSLGFSSNTKYGRVLETTALQHGFRTSLGFGGSKTSVGIQYFSRVLAKLLYGFCIYISARFWQQQFNRF